MAAVGAWIKVEFTLMLKTVFGTINCIFLNYCRLCIWRLKLAAVGAWITGKVEYTLTLKTYILFMGMNKFIISIS